MLAVAAVSAKLRAILLNKICKILQLLRCFVNSAHESQFMHKILQNSDISSLSRQALDGILWKRFFI